MKLPGAEPGAIRAIDSHIHLFDPQRKQGVPWPEKSDTVLYRPALPARYEKLAEPHGVVGAIAIECSPWPADNDWLAALVEQSPILLGYIGDLSPQSPQFAADLDRLHRNPRFLGIRYGNLWGRDLYSAAGNAEFLRGLKLVAERGLVLETANQDARLIAAAVQVTDKVPELRVVLDHLPNAALPREKSERDALDANLRLLAQRPQVYAKGSEIVHRIDGRVPLQLSAYQDTLDRIWGLFGEDRILFGSDWPNSDTVATYDQVFSIALQYVRKLSSSAQAKYFGSNSARVYRWKPRTAAQAEVPEGGKHA